jgi:hypothetical protein
MKRGHNGKLVGPTTWAGGRVMDVACGPGSSRGLPLSGTVFPYEVTTN